MSNVVIKVDVSQVQALGQLFEKAAEAGMSQLTERLEEHIRDEAPEVTGRLKSLTGITSEVKRSANAWEGEIIISARSEQRGAREGILHLPNGEEKKVKLRAEKPFNYGETVVKGRAAVYPKDARLLRVPVTPAHPLKSGERFIEADGKQYRLLKSVKASAPNDFPQRGADKLGPEIVPIMDKVLRKYLGVQ